MAMSIRCMSPYLKLLLVERDISFLAPSRLVVGFMLLAFCVVTKAQGLDQLNIDFNDVSRSSSSPFISSNGRYIVFVSSFETEQVELVSQTASGGNANAATSLPGYSGARAVTEDGRFVVFASAATNLPDTTIPSN